MHFNGFNEKLITTENNIAKKLFKKIEGQKLFPDEERDLYWGIMEVYDILHSTPNIENPNKKINEIITRRKIFSALENEIVSNIFWSLLLTHTENGRVVPHEMVLLDLKDKFGECELIDLLEEKSQEIFPPDGEFESYFFHYETTYWSIKVKLKAALREREINIILKNLFQRDTKNIEIFLKSNNIIYKDLEFMRDNPDISDSIKLSEHDYILKNYDHIIDVDNYYLYLSSSIKTANDYSRMYHNIMRVKRNKKLEYIAITQNYLETWDDDYSAKAYFFKDWKELVVSENGYTKKITGPRALFLLQNIEKFKEFLDFKENENPYY